MSDDAYSRWLVSDGHLGCRKGRSAIDSASIMVHGAHAAWTHGHIAVVLLLDITAAFPNVAKGRLVNLVKVSQMGRDIKRWTESFLSETMVEIIMEGNAMERYSLEAVVPLGSPVSPIVFVIYISGFITWIKEYVSAERLTYVDNLGWVATGRDVN